MIFPRNRFQVAILAALVVAAGASPADARNRYAFIVGNDAYRNITSLKKAVNDARAVAQSLQKFGFSVSLGENLTRRQFISSFAAFENRIQPGDIAFMFYSGHGVELNGANYLVPVDVPKVAANQQSMLKDEAISTDDMVLRIKTRGARAQVLVLDACRENPFRDKTGRALGGTRGLAGMRAPGGVFIVYSAGVGEVALDRLSNDDNNPNSVFTRSFLPLLADPNRSLVRVVKQTRARVKALARTVGRTQSPAYYDELDGDIFVARRSGTVTTAIATTTPPPSALAPVSPATPLPWMQPAPPPAPPPVARLEPQPDPNSAGFLFPDSDRRSLSRNELSGLSRSDLRIARNEIYARKGRYFKSADLRAHFGRFAWYQPFTWNPPLNAFERANVQLILSMER